MKSHHDLTVWRAAIALAKSVYEKTRGFPKEELYGLTSQMRRACTSIASNIAEGSARQGTKELIQYLYIASGSANELDTHAEIAKEVGFISAAEARTIQRDTEEVLKMLRGLIRSLKKKEAAVS
jgi:four helix bundle protein